MTTATGNALGYFEGDKTKEAKEVHLLIIGYGFENVKDKIDRSLCLQKDLQNITTSFSKYQCSIHHLLDRPKHLLLGSQNRRGMLEETFDAVKGKVDVLIVFVLTHGGSGGMICTHEEEFHKTELWNKIDSISPLKEALKIYVMEPCRGATSETRYPAGVSVPRVGQMTHVPNITNEPGKTDHAIFYASIEGQPASFCCDGTRMVIATCSVLNNLEKDVDLEEFFTRIVGQIVGEVREGLVQTAEWCLFPTKPFTIRTLNGVDAKTNKAKMKDPSRQGYFDWTTEKGDDLGPGRAFIFFDDSHKNDAEEFYNIFDKLHLEVHRPIEVKRMLEELDKISNYLEDEGLLLICVLCKLEVSNGEVAFKYSSISKKDDVSSAVGYFSSERCPAMNGKPKVYILLDNASQFDINQDNITTTNSGNNNSGSICFIGQGQDVTAAVKEELKMEYLTNGSGSIQRMFGKVANSTKDRVNIALLRDNAQPVIVPEIISRMSFLVDFPNVSSIYTKPIFCSSTESGESLRERTISFDSLFQETLNVMQNPDSRIVYLLSCDPGTGKTRTTKELSKHLRKNDIKVAVIFAKEHEDRFIYKKNWDDFVAECASEKDSSKVALLFDGVDEICPKHQAKALEFIKQAAAKYPLVWISTRPQEKDNIKKELGGKVKSLSIKPLQLNEAEKFLERSLKGTNWRSAWELMNKELGREMPRTPMLLNMLARLRRDSTESLRIFSYEEKPNIFSIYWHLINLQIKDTAKRDFSCEKNPVIIIGTHVKVALRNLAYNKVTGTLTENEIVIVNKLGFAVIENGVITFTHKTWEEFFLCLALIICDDAEEDLELKKGNKRVLLTQPEHQQVRYFLEKALQIDFKDKDNFSVNQYLLEDEGLRKLLRYSRSKLMQNCCKEGSYFIYKQLILQHVPDAFKLPEIRINELLIDACMSNEELALDLLHRIRGAEVTDIVALCKDQLQLLVSMASKNFFKLLDKFPQNMAPEALNIALFVALENGHMECAYALKRLGAKVERQDIGINALHVVLGRETDRLNDVVRFLLDVLPDSHLNELTNDELKMTPLHLAAKTGNINLVEMLLQKMVVRGISTTDVNTNGWNYFHYAVVSKSGQLVRYLIAAGGCDINAQTKDGCTPLHLAVRNGDYNIVSFLLNKGADVTIKNEHNETPARCPQDNGKHDCRDFILEKERQTSAPLG